MKKEDPFLRYHWKEKPFLINERSDSLPEGFYQTISQPVVLMDSAKRFVKIGENRVYDQSFIFARVSELIHSSRDISMEDCLKTELAQYPPAYVY